MRNVPALEQRPLRIGIIPTFGGCFWGGSEELWASTALAALRLGHKVFVSVFGRGELAPKVVELRSRGAKILRRRGFNFRGRSLPFGAAWTFRTFFRTDPDVIVVNQGATFCVVYQQDLTELLSVAPIPFVLLCHFNQNLPLANDGVREKGSNLFSRASRVLFVAEENRIDAERQLARKIPNSDIVLNPVNLSDRSYVPWPESAITHFASVARLEARLKGQDILIEALSADRWKERNWHLTLYGSGPDERYLRSLVNFFGMQDRITFAGHCSDVRAIWEKEQILVMFSRGEGTPLALVEAMVCGRPAIVSDVGGNKEWITEPHTGFVAEAPVIDLARAALERAWSARDSWKAMGLEARRVATSRLDDPNTPGLLDVLLEAGRQKKPADTAMGEELERLKQYHALMGAGIAKQALCVAKAGARRVRRIFDRPLRPG